MPRVSSTQVTSCVSPLSFIISVLLLKSFCFPFSFSFQYIIFFSIIEFILVSIYHLLLPSSSPPPPPPTNNQSQINSFKMATVKAIPPGGTFIDTLDKSFVDVPVNKEKGQCNCNHRVSPSCRVSHYSLWYIPFLPHSTPSRTILAVTSRNSARDNLLHQQNQRLFKILVINELKTKKHTATEGLVWLVRGLDFTCIALSQNLATSTDELSVSFRNAYGETLKPHHSFMVKPIFSAAMSACPYRKDFYVKLGDDNSKVEAALRVWLSALENFDCHFEGIFGPKRGQVVGLEGSVG
ncbi:hypothetical protein EYC84_000554 [Monilinia fructicola]|uniref:Glycolipid transfer protein domain-containing protein n=1 Tax=Monilinia fructicola TaxID=38448 RepID=A0A5M9JNX8_MONFR|nr:hypothetical protein EYC84_000554 [Monilinia fructicola]